MERNAIDVLVLPVLDAQGVTEYEREDDQDGSTAISFVVFAPEVKAHPVDQGRFLPFRIHWCPTCRRLTTQVGVVEFSPEQAPAVAGLITDRLNGRVQDRNVDPLWSAQPIDAAAPELGWQLVADVEFPVAQFPDPAAKVSEVVAALRHVAARHFRRVAGALYPA